MSEQNKTKYISLRLIVIIWFALFSIVPLALVTVYSSLQFENALEAEQLKRLRANAREIEVIFNDFQNSLENNLNSMSNNPHITFNLTVTDAVALREHLTNWLELSELSHISIYDRFGQKVTFVEKEYYSTIQMTQQSTKSELDSELMKKLENQKTQGFVRGVESGLELGTVSPVFNSAQKIIGFIEQKILLRQNFLSQIKNEIKLEMLLVDEKFNLINSTLESSTFVTPENLSVLRQVNPETLVDLELNKEPFSFITYSIQWPNTPFKIVIGTNKKESLAVMKNINVAFFGVTGLGILILIVTILISTSVLLKPLSQLIKGLETFENTDQLVQLKVQNRTEIGRLISTFNKMSFNVHQTRLDLKNKITELEQANKNLKEAQAQLVQSAKMTSLGQLVAGVAHELNNPIGFIYSNTSHLKDYSDKLFQLIDAAEKDISLLTQMKVDLDYDYIKEDLPKLIKSCQDGAQRTRDIVRGLRNFSRLEESQLKEIDIHEAIEMTLDLLKGETKNRIQIHRHFETIPRVYCYASQINQVIMNILTNAVHAIHGNGQISIYTQTIPASAQKAAQVQITIQDSGTGMDPEVVEKIFEPFFTTKDVGQGTGLGLSISYGIIQNHGGQILVKSQKNVGTEFVIRIPLTQEAKNNVS